MTTDRDKMNRSDLEPQPGQGNGSPRNRRAGRRLLWMALALVVLASAAFGWGWQRFGNAALVRLNRDAPLTLRDTSGQWAAPPRPARRALDERLTLAGSAPGLSVHTLEMKRSFPSRLHIVTIDPDRYRFEAAFLPKFQPTTAKDMAHRKDLDFVVNANFFTPEHKPLGWVVHRGKRAAPEWRDYSGYCFVAGDRLTICGPRKLRKRHRGHITEAVQAYPSVMCDFIIFNYIENLEIKPSRRFNATEITYRVLAGTRADGHIVFILPAGGAVLDVREMARIALGVGVKHATLLDGGGSVQYELRHPHCRLSFAASSTRVPVFWGAREKKKEEDKKNRQG